MVFFEVKRKLKYLLHLLFGFICSLFLPLNITIYLLSGFYYFIVCYIIAPFKRGLGEPIKGVGNWFATEFLKSENPSKSPRCSLVSAMYAEGTIQIDDFLQDVKRSWIEAKDPKGKLKYPEFQQYIEDFMGFMFWKQDKNFNLENHIFTYQIGAEDSKSYADRLMETLINKPYSPQRSPWDLHIVHGYRDPDLLKKTDKDSATVIMLRSHHSLADGFSIITLLLEDLLGLPLSSCEIAQYKPEGVSSPSSDSKLFLSHLLSLLTLPFKFFHDVGFGLAPIFQRRSPFHIPDDKKNWHQLYSRSPMIPIGRVKEIKNRLDCTFTGVLLSCISAGIADSLKKRGCSRENLQFIIPIPDRLHSKKLRNEMSGTVFDLPTSQDLCSLERLHRTERNLSESKQSVIPALVLLIFKLASFVPAHLIKHLYKNRTFCGGLTSFPGPGIQLPFKGGKVLSTNFAAGALSGEGSFALMVSSYHDHIQIAATAESAVFFRKELDEFILRILGELDILDGICRKKFNLENNN